MKTLNVTRMSGFGQGKTEEYTSSPVSMGTAQGCDLKYDPSWDKTVSNRHALVEWREGGWMVTDVGSREGTLVNGKRITCSVPVGEGVEIELGPGGPRIKVAEAMVQKEGTPVAETGVGGGKSNRESARKTIAWLPVLGAIGLVSVVAALLYLMWEGGNESRRTADAASEKAEEASKAAAEAIDKAKEAGEKEIPKDLDEQFLDVAKQYGDCVAVVVYAFPSGGVPNGTAWAVGKNVLATNSHITVGLKKHLAEKGSAFVALNKDPEKQYRITEAVVHPKYVDRDDFSSGKEFEAARPRNIDGKLPAVPAYDVGLIYVEGALPNHFKIASDEELSRIDSGYRVCYMGFPSENIAGGGVDIRSPVANMQSGIITSTTDYWLSKSDFSNRFLISHNLGGTGGSSGSPIFNTKGEVVAILSGGNVMEHVRVLDGIAMTPNGSVVKGGELRDSKGKVVEKPLVLGRGRIPSAAMLNYGQRVDLLKEIYPDYEKGSN